MPSSALRLAVLLMAALAAAAAQPFFFIQATDPQFGMHTANGDFSQETANFEFVVATANRLKPAFLIVTGDLVNKTGDPAQIREYLRIAAKLDPSIPIYHVPGNHDLGNEPTAQTLAAYRRAIGPDYYAFRHGDAALLVLNSPLMQAPKNVPAELEKHDAWLRAELAKARRDGARHIIVFQHHPYFVHDINEKDDYHNIPAVRRKAYLDLLAEYNVTHVFAGHLHRNETARYNALEIVATGPAGKPLGEGVVSGIRIVKVTPNAIRHEYAPLGALPSQVTLN